jgi:hypothetical protein
MAGAVTKYWTYRYVPICQATLGPIITNDKFAGRIMLGIMLRMGTFKKVN